MPTGMQNYASQTPRIGKFKGMLFKKAEVLEVLAKTGRQIKMPPNESDTYVGRRFLPYGATATDANTQNRFFADANGDRGNVMVQQHLIQEGVTPTPDSIQAVDTTVVVQQYGCLYGYTDKTFHLYEDDIPAEMVEQVAQRVTLVNEMIVWGALRACTNAYFGGTGTTVATVNGVMTMNMLRKIAMNLLANHARPVNSMLKNGINFGTDGVEEGFTVYIHTDCESDIRDIPGFIPITRYASGTPMPSEIGRVERFRFITSPDLVPIQNGGATVANAPGVYSTTGVNIDVYPFIVAAKDAWSQIAVRGLSSYDPVILSPKDREKSDPLGQRGYAGTSWWKAVMLENQGWMAVGNVGRTAL